MNFVYPHFTIVVSVAFGNFRILTFLAADQNLFKDSDQKLRI